MAKPRECIRCKKIKVINGRNLCKQCYSYEYERDNLDKYPLGDSGKKKKRYDNCIDCNNYFHIYGRDRCRKCYSKWYISQPGQKEKHAAKMREERKNKPELYRKIDRRRNQTEKRRKWRRKYQKQYYQENPEVFIKAKKKWEKKNPGIWAKYAQIRRSRERKLPHSLTEKEWEMIKKEYYHLCAYCGYQVKKLTKDHWIPVSRGGGYTKENIVPACGSCNSRKKDMTGDEFVEMLDIQEWYHILEIINNA